MFGIASVHTPADMYCKALSQSSRMVFSEQQHLIICSEFRREKNGEGVGAGRGNVNICLQWSP